MNDVMDRNILLNLKALFLHTRADANVGRLGFYAAARAALANGWRNPEFTQALRLAGYPDSQLVLGEGEPVDVGSYRGETALIERGVRDIAAAIECGNSAMAMDIADALHFLPEIIANRETLQSGTFRKAYLKPLNKKWRLRYDTRVTKHLTAL